MRLVRQMLIILAVSFAGEVLKAVVPLPIPAGIYGLVMLFLLLCAKAVRVEDVGDVSGFLIEIMPLLIVPAGAGLMEQWFFLRPVLVPTAVITVISTILVFIASGLAAQKLMKRE